ncbi:FtsJ methyltransferase domain containing 1 [Parelaphostrongylus tenuis]|uniref:Cap-specific mRNA (nucleoside-2'-O-)-methyltransferase 2 n=1 Tax=Parelaphostrongylus tenuis TaxID=148309 RepID=A0AAD5N8C5_PARTN|nr:FtsJ methyltransferase domain containing 1 [Parelaphostrongylus tenuis]
MTGASKNSSLPPLSTVVNREHCLRRNGNWCRSDISSLGSTTSLECIADEINTLKERIGAVCASDHDQLRKWRLHTQETHPLSAAPKLLREHYNCERTSQSYCKFLEILVRYPQLVSNRSHSLSLRSFHLCEAPGHFISALDRFLCTFHSNMDWFWEANSLNPHHEATNACDMILEDEVILGQPSRWHFGKDGSGDIRKWDDDYLTSIIRSGRYSLVTADGSFYTQDVPGQQELKTLPLLETELKIALKLLANGGSLVIKVYTFFMAETRSLIGKVASYFDDAFVFKPMSSKGGNNERYLICMGYRRQNPVESMDLEIDSVITNCEIYFSKLQSSFLEANLRTYNTVTKAELGVFRESVLREFRKRTLVTYIANPLRNSHLDSQPLDRPWIQMFGSNYVESLRQICDKQSAVQHLKEFIQSDCMNEYEVIDDVEVEFAASEVEFIGWSVEKLITEKVIVPGSTRGRVVHSLFTPPVLLRCLLTWKPEILVDLCRCSNRDERFSRSLESLGNVTVDLCKLQQPDDWFWLLQNVLDGVFAAYTLSHFGIYLLCPMSRCGAVREERARWFASVPRRERISQLTLVWSAHTTPFVLSRFSASVIAVLCMMFFKFSLTGGYTFATFSMPNYPEDLPPGLGSYLSLLSRISTEMEGLQCFVPTSMLAMLHPYLLSVNRRQWRDLLARENISDIEICNTKVPNGS